jgi:hypothetical protein
MFTSTLTSLCAKLMKIDISKNFSAPGGIRIHDLVLRRHLLYPLSYGGIDI